MDTDGLTAAGLLIRFVLGGGAVAAAYILAKRIGGRWGGIFAAFPAVYLAAIITVSAGLPSGEGLPLVLEVSKGALIGMLGNIMCAVAASVFIVRYGWQKGLFRALMVWLVFVSVFYIVVNKTGVLGWLG
ncbi:DUF3147 family protein [Phosphitispora fastidiosa]|uniref:DUF3147 family protein n=1 Tax=Phosphitispora fastidiosa TaxID=2837202 RepID=UPI001E39C6C9|nr:DUF3147 family protein [Phosphitispora fastidiosa]MBU7006466.1 putative membrane protein (GlpM family) [Phosphitispora fastidiosa]